MNREGEIRIPSGCAIAAVISRDGKKMSGEMITQAMKPMHERSNGLGGGFAGYGIYPEYKDFYALHTSLGAEIYAPDRVMVACEVIEACGTADEIIDRFLDAGIGERHIAVEIKQRALLCFNIHGGIVDV